MKKKQKMKTDYHEHDDGGGERFPGISNVASANECTGLMYRAPQTGEELEAYRQLSSMAIPKEGEKELPSAMKQGC